jgi:predicted ATPase/transcriptional regulator with XRE-family HTH domain
MDDSKYAKDWPHEWIKKIRTRPSRRETSKKMRQVDLAKRVGVDPRTVQQWESGDRLPSIGNLKQIIQVFWEEGLFLKGDPRQEAEQLWMAVKRLSEARSATRREFEDFDKAWFDTLMTTKAIQPETGKEKRGTAVTAPARLRKMPSTFVGRHQSRDALAEQLTHHALVSIIGSGGIGKTSLAVELASTLTERFPQGIWMFEFGAISEAHDVGPFLLSTLGLSNQGSQPDVQVVLETAINRNMLFIFDNCEHLIDVIATVAESLLAEAPELSILATSREPLNIAEEYVYRIPPLSFPVDEVTLDELSETELINYESVQLFLERASIQAPHFAVSLPHLKRIASICKKIGGIPLAIELAVARMNMLTLEQIEERLTNQLTLLTVGKRTATPRHQTLRSTIDWSYNLLTGRERLLLRRLSVFEGGFTLEAVEGICICEPDIPDREDRITVVDVVDLLSSLVNKSLVSTQISSHYGSIRYFLLEAIKEYASDKFREESDDRKRDALYERHVRYYMKYLLQAESQFRSIERESCIEAVRREYANLRSALQWSYSSVQVRPSGLHMAAHLYWFWLHEGRLKDGLFWLERFLYTEEENHAFRTDSAKAWHGLSIIQFIQGHTKTAMEAATRSVEIAREQQEISLLASSLRLLAFLHIKQNCIEEAETVVQQSADLARSAHDSWNLASSLHAYGKIRLEQHRYNDASVLLRESVHLFETVQDQWEVSGPYECLGYTALKLGKLDQSIEYFKKCIAASQIYRGSWVLSRGIEGLGITLCAQGALTDAAILLGAAEKGRQAYDEGSIPNFPDEHRKSVSAIQQGLQEQEWYRWWNKGKEMTQAQALAYALEI